MAQPKKLEDLTFMFLMLNVHKQGAWNFQAIADKMGGGTAKSVENRYYKLKKTYFDAMGGAEMMGVESTSTPAKTKAKATPKSKKRQPEADGDDEEATPTAKGKRGAKKIKESNGDAEEQTKEDSGDAGEQTKVEPGSEGD